MRPRLAALARIALAGLALGALAAGAGAQPAPPGHEAGATAAVPDVPAGPAAIRGRVIHPERPAAAAGVEVALYALSASGEAGVRRVLSGADGRFAFENVANDPGTTYLIGARFADVPYPGARVVFEAGEREREVEVRVGDATHERDAVVLVEHRLQLDPVGARLRVVETLVLRNTGTRTVYVPAAERGRAVPALRTRLPEGASEFAVPFDLAPEGLVQKGDELSFYGPIYPGEQELSWSWALPAPSGRLTLSRTLPAAAEKVVVLAPLGGPAVEVAGLSGDAEVEVAGRRYRRLEGGARRAGARLDVALDIAATRADPGAVSLAETRVILDADAAVLDVREEHVLAVSGDSPVLAPEGRSLLTLSLPVAARDLRFATSAPDTALEATADGSLGVIGPLPPGESSVEIRYRLPVGGAEVDWQRRFSAALPLLSVYVADTGRLALDSARLHRRRPVRTADRSYAHLEAFEVEPGEEIALRITELPPRRGLSRPLALGLAALLAAGAIAAVVAPLRRGPTRAEDAEPVETPALREREALYASIRDLEHDFETGKISEADHAALRDELRARAVALLRREREAARTAPSAALPRSATPSAAASCPACGAERRPADRFCAQCGLALAPAPEQEARA
jgi:hypothetical protein